MSTRIPPLLEPYLSLPPETSLIVLTSVLGASTNWLVLRYLHALLNSSGSNPAVPPSLSSASPDEGGSEAVSVLLVSFLRDFPFWRDSASRIGVDLESVGRSGRFGFVDGLDMFLPSSAVSTGEAAPWRVRLWSHRPEDVKRTLVAAVDGMRAKGGKVVLVVDQLDVLLATAGEEEGSGERLRDVLFELRELTGQKTHATILTLSADEPLVASQTTELEKEHAALVLSAVHEAEVVLSLRLLDTGTAKDVSGVIRSTRGGAGEEVRGLDETEYLYHVLGDGGVRVFERGQ